MQNKITQEIKKLKEDIKPRSEWLTLNRDILLSQINKDNQHKVVKIGMFDYIQMFSNVLRQQVLEPAVIIVLVLITFLGSSLTINAAFYSLPGDNLYPVKIALEKTHIALIPDADKRVELNIEFAQKRVAEFDKIVRQKNIDPVEKKQKITAVVKEFRNNVVAVNDHVSKINKNQDATEKDKQQQVNVALNLSSQTEDLARSLDKTINSLSEVEKLEVQAIVAEAIDSTKQLANEVNEAIKNENEEEGDEANGEEEGVADETGEVTEGKTVEEGTVEGVNNLDDESVVGQKSSGEEAEVLEEVSGASEVKDETD